MNIAAALLYRARAHPDAPCISFNDRTQTYGDLLGKVMRVGGGLRRELDLPAGARVVLCLENRPEFFEVLFACWVAGLVAVPVNAKLHAREVAHIVRDCGALAIVTTDKLVDALRAAVRESDGHEPAILVAGSGEYARLLESATMDCAAAQATDTAWIFYTSGTTGRSKGAMLSHRNLMFMSLAYYADIEHVDRGDVKLHAAPLSHASGLYALPHLFGGGHQVVLGGFDPDAVLSSFEQHRNVTLFAAPTMLTRLVSAAGKQAPAGGLRTLYYGGGPMYVSDLQRALGCFGPRLWQLYGQGESPMTISGLRKRDHEGDGSASHLARLASCGTPRTGVGVRVVDEAGRDLPAGEPGEVITRSDAVMAGYWNNAEASAAALRDGWLWTGDVGAFDELGYLTLRDRSKDLIISGGSNIYPREIEEALLRHPGLLECSVVGRPDADWGEAVVAFVVERQGHAVADDELDAVCLQNIARFKRPREYVRVAELPKNNYGKVLKTELRRRLDQEAGDA